MNHSHFRKGSGVYTCRCCARLTRGTGAQALGSDLCPQCYELAGYENCVQDNCFDANDAVICQGLVRELVAKGVPLETVKRKFDLLPAEVFA